MGTRRSSSGRAAGDYYIRVCSVQSVVAPWVSYSSSSGVAVTRVVCARASRESGGCLYTLLPATAMKETALPRSSDDAVGERFARHSNGMACVAEAEGMQPAGHGLLSASMEGHRDGNSMDICFVLQGRPLRCAGVCLQLAFRHNAATDRDLCRMPLQATVLCTTLPVPTPPQPRNHQWPLAMHFFVVHLCVRALKPGCQTDPFNRVPLSSICVAEERAVPFFVNKNGNVLAFNTKHGAQQHILLWRSAEGKWGAPHLTSPIGHHATHVLHYIHHSPHAASALS